MLDSWEGRAYSVPVIGLKGPVFDWGFGSLSLATERTDPVTPKRPLIERAFWFSQAITYLQKNQRSGQCVVQVRRRRPAPIYGVYAGRRLRCV